MKCLIPPQTNYSGIVWRIDKELRNRINNDIDIDEIFNQSVNLISHPHQFKVNVVKGFYLSRAVATLH